MNADKALRLAKTMIENLRRENAKLEVQAHAAIAQRDRIAQQLEDAQAEAADYKRRYLATLDKVETVIGEAMTQDEELEALRRRVALLESKVHSQEVLLSEA